MKDMAHSTEHNHGARKRGDRRGPDGALEMQLLERTVRLETLSQRLRLLAARLTDREQRERRRLAQLVHDHLQQFLVGAKIRVTLAANQTDPATRDQLQGAIEMIDDGLRIARSLTAELRPPVLYEVGLPPALRWLAGQLLEQHGLTVRLSLDENAKQLNERMRALLFDAVRELLLNVVSHSGVKEATVRVRRERSEVHTSVQDLGRGFDVSVIDPTSSNGEQFGLFSIRERLRAVGGQCTIASSFGHGTRVDLFLPLQADELAEVASMDHADDSGVLHPAHRPAANGERLVRVLLADDHQIVREGIASILSAQPAIAVVAQARDGEEAVTLARRLHPDVIVMDVNMPRMNGIEATRRIISEQPDTPIIGLSVQDESGTADAMLRAGATAYLFKGGDPDDLVGCILTAAHADTGASPEASCPNSAS
jgi:CheY-like chemotaxis protein